MSDESILIRGVDRLGDSVMTMPALMRLREAKPDARITLLTPEELVDLWTDHPAIDEVISFAAGESVFSVAKKIRARSFDTAIIFPNSPRSAMECWKGNVTKRIGYERPWRNWMLTNCIPLREDEQSMEKRPVAEIRLLLETGIEITPKPLPGKAHHVYQYLELVGNMGAKLEPCDPVIVVSDEEKKETYKKFDKNIIPGSARTRPLIGINAGAKDGPAKQWPKERFIEAAIGFTKGTPCDWWVFGGEAETALAQEIATAIDKEFSDMGTAVSLAGRTSLRELCAALKNLDALVTNDSGPMHVAGAVGTPVVAIFGSTSPELTGLSLADDSPHRILRKQPACSPCFHQECPVDFRCMNEIRSDQVVAALKDILKSD